IARGVRRSAHRGHRRAHGTRAASAGTQAGAEMSDAERSRAATLRRRVARALPFGVGAAKPHHYRDMLRVAWQNRDQLPFAWRILRDGVCDGCALGPRGLRDDVIDGVHLCMTRLELLRLNTMPALDSSLLDDVP